jgi:hypothetical protein
MKFRNENKTRTEKKINNVLKNYFFWQPSISTQKRGKKSQKEKEITFFV